MRYVLLLVCLLSGQVSADSYSDAVDVFRSSATVGPYFENAYGYALFPNVGKAGLGFGGSYGRGRVYVAGGEMTGVARLVKLSVGFQAGGQAFAQIVFFEDEQAFNDFTTGNFEFDATASAVAITVGVQAQAGTTGASLSAGAYPDETSQEAGDYYKGMMIFTYAKGGLMYEATIGGQKFSYDGF